MNPAISEDVDLELPRMIGRPAVFSLLVSGGAALLCVVLAIMVANVDILDPIAGIAARSGEDEVQIRPTGLTFSIPDDWLRWNSQHGNNIHLSRLDLAAVRDATGGWDREYAIFLNAALPFDACVAHLGAEGWGEHSASSGDLQLRVYLFGDHPDTVRDALTKTAEKRPGDLFKITGGDQNGNSFAVDTSVYRGLPRVKISWNTSQGDSGGGALVDARLMDLGNKTAVFCFMYKEKTATVAETNNIVDSGYVPE